MSPTRTDRPTREEKKAATRTRLLEAASVVFARRGFAGASLDDVAEEAGLTKGAVYSNFDSKEHLIRALLEERLGGPSLAIPPGIDPSLPRSRQAELAGGMFMHLVDEERDAYLLELELSLYLARNPDKRNPGGYNERVQAMAVEIEERAAEAGVALPLPAHDLATAVFALGTGLALERLVDPDRVPPDLFGKMLAVIFAGASAPAPGDGNR